MPFGKPAITTPGRLDLRPVQEAITNTRQRIEAIESAVTVLQNLGASASATSIAALQAQINALVLADGTVTSIDATVPSFLSVSGVPITGSGTIGITLDDQPRSLVFAGPVSGADSAPTFRALQWNFDLPLITSASFISGLDGSEQVLIERYGNLYWTTTQTIANLSTGGSGGTTPITPDTIPSPENAANDEFETGSSLDTTGSRRPGATPWTWLTAPTTNVISDGALVVTPPASSSTLSCFDQPVSGSTFRYRTKLAFMQQVNVSQIMQGMYFRNSANGKCVSFLRLLQTGPSKQIEFERWTNMTTPSFSAAMLTRSWDSEEYGEFKGSVWMDLEYDGTDIIARTVRNGYTQGAEPFYTETAGTFLGGAPTHVGLYVFNSSALSQSFGFQWFRKIA